VHDARVVQIQRTERLRFGHSEAGRPARNVASAPRSAAFTSPVSGV
jgi:hypothetical protein